jgi:hypothetical protein
MLFGKGTNLRGNIGIFSFLGFRGNSPCPAEDEARLEGNMSSVGIAVFLGFTGFPGFYRKTSKKY